MADNEVVKESLRDQLKILRWVIYPIDMIIFLLILLQLSSFIGFQQKVILSNSMVPYMRAGDSVIVKEGNIGDMVEGDVICFMNGENAVCHRVYSMNGDGTVTTKGDAVQEPDSMPVTKDEFVGKVIFKIPSGAMIYSFLQSIWFKLIVVLLVALTFFI